MRIRSALRCRFRYAPAVDDAEVPAGPQIAADRFRDASRQPRGFGITRDVGEVEHGDRMVVDPGRFIDYGAAA